MHQRQHMCAVAPDGSALILLTLRFADEILPMSADDSASAKIAPTELTMAKQLIARMSAQFQPGHFKDTYRSDLRRRVQEKLRKKQTHALDVEPRESARPKAQVIDLTEALKASLAKGKNPSRTPARRRAGTKKTA
jgi:DNA end-binding protein Ku